MDTTVKSLEAAIKFRQMRQELMASNIANADTPGYKAKRLDFEEALARAIDVDNELSMKSSDQKHFDVGNGGFDNLAPHVYEDPNGVVSENGNTVERDKELAAMAENQIMYNAAVQLMNKKLGMMKYAIGSDKD